MGGGGWEGAKGSWRLALDTPLAAKVAVKASKEAWVSWEVSVVVGVVDFEAEPAAVVGRLGCTTTHSLEGLPVSLGRASR